MKGVLALGFGGLAVYGVFALLCALIGGVGLAAPVQMPESDTAGVCYQIAVPSVGAVTVHTRVDGHADFKHGCSNMPPARIRELIEQGAYRLMTDGDGNYAAIVTDPETGLTGGRVFYRDAQGAWQEKTTFGGDQCDPSRWSAGEYNAWQRAGRGDPSSYYWRTIMQLRGYHWL